MYKDGPERQIPITGYGIPEETVVKVPDAFYDQEDQVQEDAATDASQEFLASDEQIRISDRPARVRVSNEMPRAPKDLETAAEKPKRFKRTRLATKLAVVGLAAFGAYGLFSGDDAEHTYRAEIVPKETKVFPDVYLNLVDIESTFHLEQNTQLDRGDGGFLDLNPFDYNFKIDQDITTKVSAGMTVEKLTAIKDNKAKTLAVQLKGDFAKTIAAVDWETNHLDVEFDDAILNAGFDNKEQNKARNSANMLVQGAGGVAASCAFERENVQDLFTDGVEKFLKTTSFAEGIALKNITVEIVDIDNKALDTHKQAVKDLDRIEKKIQKNYDNPGQKFKIERDALIDCSQHKITTLDEKPTKP